MFDEKGVVITETLLKLPKQTIALSGITSVRSGSNPVYPEASGKKVLLYIASFILLESFFFLVMVGNFGFWFMGVNPLAVLRGIGSGNAESVLNFSLVIFLTTIQGIVLCLITRWFVAQKRRQWVHYIVITTASGETRPLEDLDQSFILRVVLALEKALSKTT
ncbi:MAG: hypothetical protein JHC56_12150 [Gemmataceae bacterium]|jgi:Family of unknown function (DUF6232)|nr:hypothetical protein [Gemmataceae bacterium]MBJ7432080.1 hypothetical protein [Gemmataceae bacterium]